MTFEIDYVNKMVSEFLGFNIPLNTFVSMEKDTNKYLINLDTNKIKNMDSFLNMLSYKLSSVSENIAINIGKRTTIIMDEDTLIRFINIVNIKKGDLKCGM